MSGAKRGILVGVDGSPPAKVAVDWAAREAASRHLPLTLVHVLGFPVVMMWPEVPMPPEYVSWQEDQGSKILGAACTVAEQAAGDSGGVRIHTEMPTGQTLAVLVDLTRDADLVVVGSYLAMGNTERASAVLQKALALEPGSARPYLELGQLYSNADQLDQAVLHFRKALELEPGL